ncbi:MAG: hypothetical protein LRY75_20870 [Shewanella xiamenensis]|uniref:hypothetical protein n=1 Tax=Shewanella TaxID=22 RepID=UPI0021C1B31F|nr:MULTISPECIES: hypothetical protein [Shewanella]MCD8561208.1 hypothetical protein [Shewanella xiamenensis]MCT8860467.1 hypothetical protein [Shewanella xiamenensis]MDN5498690.1 hypothetical protein [Shewanella sp.]MDN5526633.1 hypothetical protein [Shewanella sp.]
MNDHASLTQRTQMPCGNSEGMVNSYYCGVGSKPGKSYACPIFQRANKYLGIYCPLIDCIHQMVSN